MDPAAPGRARFEPAGAPDPAPAPSPAADPAAGSLHVIPSVREMLPSFAFGAGLPLGVYFVARHQVHTDAQALIVAGCFSVAWIIVQAVRRRRVDFIGAIVLFGFAVGVVTSTLLGGNAYVLKVRDAVFILLFGVVLIVTLFTHDRPALFYVSRYLSAGNDPGRIEAFDRLYQVPVGRRTFRVLSVAWGLGLVAEGALRMFLADVLPTAAFLAVSPVVTATVIGSLFGFTALYSRRVQEAALATATATAPATATPTAPANVVEPAPGVTPGDPSPASDYPQIPLP